MAKDKEREKEKKMLIGCVWNCAAELKLLLTTLLILASIATLSQVFPFRLSLSSSDLRHCLSPTAIQIAVEASAPVVSPPLSSPLNLLPMNLSPPNHPPPDFLPPKPLPSNPPPPLVQRDQSLPNGIVKRAFNPFGAAAYNFIFMSAYRGGLDTFAILGLASKPLHVFGNAVYQCEWIPNSNAQSVTVIVPGTKFLPDWGYGRVYTTVVVNCTFPHTVGGDGSGGKLILHASTGGGGDKKSNITDRIETLVEEPKTMDASIFSSPPKYDYLYCGSSLFGDLSPQRVREWIAYHVKLFGESSHFVIHDAGGIHDKVLQVLRPWMELGYVTLHDIRDQERFDGYYHNQFLVVNDCLQRYKFDAKWMFFFDVDEFIYVPPRKTLKSVLDWLSDYTQFTIDQMPMSSQLCRSSDASQISKKWGMEKLVYRDTRKGIRRDRKYAVQPRNVLATGVHMSQNLAPKSKTTHKTEHIIRYYHYHGTIAMRRDPCARLLNATRLTLDNVPYVLDTTMRTTARSVKKFEFRMIGKRLWKTRQ